MKDLFMGADPGKSGAFIVLNRDGSFHQEIRMDETLLDIGKGLRGIRRDVSFCMIERVHSMPKQGVASSFKFGDAFGIMRGMVTVCNIRHEYMTAKDWQTKMKCKTGGDKKISKAAAQRLFPNEKIIHQNADAFLLAELARRIGIERGW